MGILSSCYLDKDIPPALWEVLNTIDGADYWYHQAAKLMRYATPRADGRGKPRLRISVNDTGGYNDNLSLDFYVEGSDIDFTPRDGYLFTSHDHNRPIDELAFLRGAGCLLGDCTFPERYESDYKDLQGKLIGRLNIFRLFLEVTFEVELVNWLIWDTGAVLKHVNVREHDDEVWVRHNLTSRGITASELQSAFEECGRKYATTGRRFGISGPVTKSLLANINERRI